MPKQIGFLMAMMEPPSAIEDEFNDWYDTEHQPNRAAIPGFASARRFVCISGWPKYAAFYDLDEADVLETDTYRAATWEHFSPWSKRILAQVRGLYRASGDQIYPGTALTGTMGRLTLIRFRSVPDSENSLILKGVLANYERRPETTQTRLFRSNYDNQIDFIAMIESRVPFADASIDLSRFGDAAPRIDLVNEYVPIWTRGQLRGISR